MKINDIKIAKKKVKEAINPALSFEHDDPEFSAKKRGLGYFDYSTLKREDFNDDDWYVWDPEQQQFVASYGAKSLTALDFRMRASFGGTYTMPDGRVAMRGMKAQYMPGIESRGDSDLKESAKTLQMIEGWEEFKQTAPALKEIRYRRRRTNEGMSRRAFLGGLGSLAAGAALGHAYTKDQQQQAYRENVQQAELFTDRAEQALTAGDIKSACRYFSRAADAYDNAGLEKFAEPLRQLSLDCMKKSGMSQGKGMMEGSKKQCPPATQDITLNLKNRQKAIDEYGYGPLNPDMPNRKFWMKKVDEWNLDSVEEAQQSLCGNCAAFDQRQDTLDCIATGIGSDAGENDPTIKAGDLGYCRFLKFKCASRRTCDAWVTGGPLTDETNTKELDENLRDWFKEKWVRFGPDGKIRGDCARGSESEGKPKCLPQAKAHALGKKGRASAAARKRREDPDANRRGAAINVATKKKTNEEQIDELKCWDGYTRVRGVPAGAPGSCKKKTNEGHEMCPECGGAMYPNTMINEKKDACYYKVKASAKVWPSAYASGRLVQCRKRGAANYGKKSESVAEDQLDEKWSKKYKASIDCSNPKGFSQRAHCAGRKKNESVDEAANAAQQAAIAINMKKHHKKPKQAVAENDSIENIEVRLDGNIIPGPYNDIDHARNKASKLISYQKGKVAEVYVDGKLKMRMKLNTPREYFDEQGIAEDDKDNAAALKTIRGPHGKLDVDRSEKGVTKVKRQNWRQSGGATVSGGYGVGVPQSTKFSSVDSEHNANRRRLRLDRDEVSEDDKDTATTAKKPGFVDDFKQGIEDYKDLWMMGATGRTPERWKTSAEKAAERGSAPGPQFPLKEGRMKEIAIEFQDYKHLPDMAFQSRYKISKRDWWNKYSKLIQGSGLGIGMDEARGKVKAKVVHSKPTRAEREHDRIRKERGLPNPSHYKTLGDKLDQELAKLRGDDVTEANIDADELVSVYIKGQHKGRSLKIPVAKNFPNKHIDLLTRRLEARGINPSAIHYGPITRKVAEDTDQ